MDKRCFGIKYESFGWPNLSDFEKVPKKLLSFISGLICKDNPGGRLQKDKLSLERQKVTS